MSLICPICGKVIDSKVKSLDHIFPQAIYKWLEYSLKKYEYNKLKNRICSKTNTIYAHNYCNINKQEDIPDINNLIINKYKKQSLISLQKTLQPSIDKFLSIKNEVINKQNNLCYDCGKELKNNTGVIRRIDSNKERVITNCKIVCKKCNRIA